MGLNCPVHELCPVKRIPKFLTSSCFVPGKTRRNLTRILLGNLSGNVGGGKYVQVLTFPTRKIEKCQIPNKKYGRKQDLSRNVQKLTGFLAGMSRFLIGKTGISVRKTGSL